MTGPRDKRAARLAAIGAAGLWAIAGALHAGSVQVEPGLAADGSAHSLAISVDSECGDPPERDLSGQTLSASATVVACETVLAGDARIESPADVVFRAGAGVSFGPGFSVQQGAALHARIRNADVRGGFLQDDSPNVEPHYAVRFFFNLDDLTVGSGDRPELLRAEDGLGRRWLTVALRFDSGSGENRLLVDAAENDGSIRSTEGSAEIAPGPGWHRLELEWFVADPGDTNGRVLVTLDGVTQPGLTGLVNDAGKIDRVRWGALNVADQTTGTLRLDEFVSRRAGAIDPP